MNKDKKYLKIIGTTVFLFLFIYFLTDFFITFEINKIKTYWHEERDVVGLLTQKCIIDYKDIHYEGSCNVEILEALATKLIIDKRVEVLQICMPNPYAYRYEICEQISKQTLEET